MGIKGLWTVLAPYSEKKSLHEIRGEKVAVDLSGWVCDSQNVTEYHIQPKLYLRNLFFRTIYLLLADINPIFVLEGDAPELKRDVMAVRNAIQFRGALPRNDQPFRKPDVSRKRFKGVLRECESLLKCMGVRCIKGSGEAEATCAQLNAQGYVDAVVSQDSDCFAYGAKRVYRNFSVSSSAGGGAMQGSIDCYDADAMYKCNGFGRNKMVALAILVGCDYAVGACGSSINTVVSFLHAVPEADVIPRLLSWVTSPEEYEERERWAMAPGRCDRCGHGGRTHLKNGCPTCGSHRGCNDIGHKLKVAEVKRELSLRQKALSCGIPFPEPKVMKEFSNTTVEKLDLNNLQIPAPNLIQFVKLMSNKLDWSERYCVEKFLPLLTKWHLQENIACRTIKPVQINKKRTPRGVPSYEVVWSDIDGQYEELIPDDQLEEGEDRAVPWTSIERQDLMQQYYPNVVETYEESIKKPPKVKKARGRKKKDNVNENKRKITTKAKDKIDMTIVNASMNNLDLHNSDINISKSNVSVSVNKLKRKIKNTTRKGSQKTLDSFVAKKRQKPIKRTIKSLRTSFRNLSIVNNDSHKYLDDMFDNIEKETHKENIFFSMFDNTVEDIEDPDLSNLIDKIVTNAPLSKTAKVNNNLVKLVFDRKQSTPTKSYIRKRLLIDINNPCSTPIGSPIRKNSNTNHLIISLNNSVDCKVNTSYFFDKLTDDPDCFEISVEQNKNSVINLDAETTVDYSLPDICI